MAIAAVREVPTSAAATLSADAWSRFRRNRLALVGLIIVGALLVAAA